jgi:nucleotide-binding universal stress UspA family protein
MFRNVMVPVGGTPLCEHALPWALAAVGTTGSVQLVHVHVPPVPLLVEGMVVADPTLDTTMREQEADYLGDLALRVTAAEPGVSVTTRTLEADEPPAETLAQAVKDTGAELVVMATHGRGSLARFWLGSVSHDLLRLSAVPVLLYRPPTESAPDLAVRPSLHCIVVPLDGSELSRRIVAPSIRLGRIFGAEMVLLSVGEPGLEEATAGGTNVDWAAGEMATAGLSVRTEVLRHASVATAVLDVAGGDSQTAVALATHGRTGVSRLLLGSVTDEIVRHAAGPVLAFHPPE